MNRHDFGSRGRLQEREVRRADDDKIQYLLGAEEHLLRLISARAPLRGMLDEICSALDCQIGNVVSLISLPENDAVELITIAKNAALFGLYAFCSLGIVCGNGELLGSLETYSCDSRNPTASEVQCIERARCLASIAIKRHNEVVQKSNCGMFDGRPARGCVLGWPDIVH